MIPRGSRTRETVVINPFDNAYSYQGFPGVVSAYQPRPAQVLYPRNEPSYGGYMGQAYGLSQGYRSPFGGFGGGYGGGYGFGKGGRYGIPRGENAGSQFWGSGGPGSGGFGMVGGDSPPARGGTGYWPGSGVL